MPAVTRSAPREAIATWHVLGHAAQLEERVAGRILALAAAAIADHGCFRIVLAGGRTPGAVYRRLADAAADWPRWQVYFGDERCLPADDPERNSVMAARAWLDRVPIPPEQVHPVPAEQGAAAAAAAYRAIVQAALPFDLVLLGMGEDGHTASLFPGHVHAAEELVHAVHDAPKPPPERVSLGLAALNDAGAVMVLVTGSGKRAAVERWRRGDNLPVARVHGRNGVDVYLDAEAAGVEA
ncbi:MAG: 6-phosphogluconolactonase [Gammaproteobacteria bacterium]|jgi:6-phosphogluconolactonase